MNGSWKEKIFSVWPLDGKRQVVSFLGVNFVTKRRNAVLRSTFPDADKLPISPNKIVFRCENNNYRCNPKYIAEEIIKRQLQWKLVWIVDQNIQRYKDDFPASIHIVGMGSDEALSECSTARVIVDNVWRIFLLNRGVKKRPGQVYMQTWRGSYGGKKFGLARHSCSLEYFEAGMRDISQVDYFISNSCWETELYKKTFRCNDGKILELGHPRNDILFRREEYGGTRDKVFQKSGIPEHKKLLLYAPTRNDERTPKAYNLAVARVLNACSEKWGGEWMCAARMTFRGDVRHYLPKNENIIFVRNYADVQELLVAADVCVSDYSSCIFDFLHTGKPAFIFAPDRREYERSRGLYYPLSETPFSVAENNEQLVNNILNFRSDQYLKRTQSFLRSKGSIEDGHAAERVVNFLQTIMECKPE